MQYLKNLAKLILPEFLLIYIKKYVQRKKIFNQKLTLLKCGDYEIFAPCNHILINLKNKQPYRDLCIGISAKYIYEKYPTGTIIDIGANIGDTAAIIATYSKSKLILVEGSNYFFNILTKNLTEISNEIILHNAFVFDGSSINGTLHHWGGTSYFDENNNKDAKTQHTVKLCDIADDKSSFIKIDTDGYDFKILLNSIEWLSQYTPAILFENSIRNIEDFNNSQELIKKLYAIGYQSFVIWDDAGYHLVSTNLLNVVEDLNKYLFKIWQNIGHKSIYNYDILCLHSKDEDVYTSITNWYHNY